MATKDYKQAVHWCTKAAEQGLAGAQANLAIMYYNGEGTTQNFKRVYAWVSLAAAQDHKGAAKNRDIIAKMLTPQQLFEAQKLAAKLQEKIDSAKSR